jgi:hypothetical protein
MADFIKYGRFDTIEHARNGLKGPDAEKIAQARVDLYKVHNKAKELLNAKDRNRRTRKAR